MKGGLKIKLSVPIPILHKKVEADWRDLFKAVGKTITDASFMNWGNVALDGVDFIAALGLATTIEESVWFLVKKSLFYAIFNLVITRRDLLVLDPEKRDWDYLGDCLDCSIDGTEILINEDFFLHPKQSPILSFIRKPFEQWLQNLVKNEAQIQSISACLPTYFVYALHEEWAKDSNYKKLLPEITPFTLAVQREQEWALYGALLQKQIEEPMFLEAFGVRQVYVKPCAYYTQKSESKIDYEFLSSSYSCREIETRVVVELWDELLAWLKEGDRTDAVRVICGGPGCGKSSFTRMIAAYVSETMEISVLYIPLHHFDPAKDLIEAVGDYVSIYQLFSYNPISFDFNSVDTQIFIIFDGLDELAMQGKVGYEVAQSFLNKVQHTVENLNHKKTRLQVLFSGRDVVVQLNSNLFRNPGQILHLLPYFVVNNEFSDLKGAFHEYLDKLKLLSKDRRHDWWLHYGRVSGLGYSQMPPELDLENLTEITVQPLLNYLLALVHKDENLTIEKDSNLNKIYMNFLSAIYKREWEGNNAKHATISKMSFNDFVRILEAVALSAWHGDGRTTTVKEIEVHCENIDDRDLLKEFEKRAESGFIRLLTAFYFRQSGQRDSGDRTFEFTHKSFGEYLTARRLVRGVSQMYLKLEEIKRDIDCGWNQSRALEEWAKLTCPTKMNFYLSELIRNEVQLVYRDKPDLVEKWQMMLCSLIGVMLNDGMPMERLGLPTFYEMNLQAQYAEEALLVMLNACARSTEVLSKIDWGSRYAFRTWLNRLQGQEIEVNLTLGCLDFLDLTDCFLALHDLTGASLIRTCLDGARLDGARLDGASLDGASLDGASLDGASLDGARLDGASLDGASLDGAVLYGAYLRKAHLEGARLEGAILEGVRLDGAHLERARLDGACLIGAVLDGAHLEGARLNMAHLEGASLDKAHLYGADFTKTFFNRDTSFKGVHDRIFAINLPDTVTCHAI
jgi:uncharacterized protein YjbI with pentapeptide repeats